MRTLAEQAECGPIPHECPRSSRLRVAQHMCNHNAMAQTAAVSDFSLYGLTHDEHPGRDILVDRQITD